MQKGDRERGREKAIKIERMREKAREIETEIDR